MDEKERKGDLEIEYTVDLDGEEVDGQTTISDITFKQSQKVLEAHELGYKVKSFSWR